MEVGLIYYILGIKFNVMKFRFNEVNPGHVRFLKLRFNCIALFSSICKSWLIGGEHHKATAMSMKDSACAKVNEGNY